MNMATTGKNSCRQPAKVIDVDHRMLDAIDPTYARQAHRARKRPMVSTLKRIPDPRPVATLYEAGGVRKTLDSWAKESGIPKTTLFYRVVTRRMPMEEALAKGTPGRRKPPSPPEGRSGECDTGVIVSVEIGASNGAIGPAPGEGTPQIPRETTLSSVRPDRFERTTFGFEGQRLPQESLEKALTWAVRCDTSVSVSALAHVQERNCCSGGRRRGGRFAQTEEGAVRLGTAAKARAVRSPSEIGVAASLGRAVVCVRAVRGVCSLEHDRQGSARRDRGGASSRWRRRARPTTSHPSGEPRFRDAAFVAVSGLLSRPSFGSHRLHREQGCTGTPEPRRSGDAPARAKARLRQPEPGQPWVRLWEARDAVLAQRERARSKERGSPEGAGDAEHLAQRYRPSRLAHHRSESSVASGSGVARGLPCAREGLRPRSRGTRGDPCRSEALVTC